MSVSNRFLIVKIFDYKNKEKRSSMSGDNLEGDNPEGDNPEGYDPLYLRGIKHFNECEFFEAHDTWEELWTEYRGEGRKFYQGMIQTAVALHHFGNGNTCGARKVYYTSIGYLQEYPTVYEGIDIEVFLAQFKRCFQKVLDCEEERPKIEIDPEWIPEIHLLAT